MRKDEKKMYNEELKNRYIDYAIANSQALDIEAYKKLIYNRFTRSGILENEIGKDILNMSEEELILFFSQFLKGGKNYQLNTFASIKAYCVWGIKNGLSSLNAGWVYGLMLSDIELIQNYEDIMVSGEQELIACINHLLDKIDRDTQDNIIRCICLLLFSGILYDDIWFIKITDVDLINKKIAYRNRIINMSDNLYKIIQHNIKMDSLLVTGKNNEYLRAIVNEGYLISNTKAYGPNREKIKRSFTAILSKKLSNCEEKQLTNSTIYDSGVFFRIFQNERETGEINYSEYLWARRNLTTTIDYPERVIEKCKYEYNIWKKSFNLK